MLTLNEMYSLYSQICRLYAIAVIANKRKIESDLTTDEISPLCCIKIGKLLGIKESETIDYMLRVLSGIAIQPDRNIEPCKPLNSISEQPIIQAAIYEVDWVFYFTSYEKATQALYNVPEDQIYSRLNFFLNCIGRLMAYDQEEYSDFIDMIKTDPKLDNHIPRNAWSISDITTIVNLYQEKAIDILTELKNHSINEGLEILRNNTRINIAETTLFHEWIPYAESLGIEPHELLKSRPNVIKLFYYEGMSIKRTQEEIEQQYINCCIESAQAAIAYETRDTLNEEATTYGKILQIPAHYTKRFIEEYFNHLLEKKCFDMLDDNGFLRNTSHQSMTSSGNQQRSPTTNRTKETPAQKQVVPGRDAKTFIQGIYHIYRSVSNLYFYGHSEKGQRKISNAIRSYAFGVEKSDIIFCYDDTVFGGAEDGFLVTTKDVYVHNFTEDAAHISLAKITNIQTEFNSASTNIILQSSTKKVSIHITGTNKSEINQLVSLLKDIRDTF